MKYLVLALLFISSCVFHSYDRPRSYPGNYFSPLVPPGNGWYCFRSLNKYGTEDGYCSRDYYECKDMLYSFRIWWKDWSYQPACYWQQYSYMAVTINDGILSTYFSPTIAACYNVTQRNDAQCFEEPDCMEMKVE